MNDRCREAFDFLRSEVLALKHGLLFINKLISRLNSLIRSEILRSICSHARPVRFFPHSSASTPSLHQDAPAIFEKTVLRDEIFGASGLSTKLISADDAPAALWPCPAHRVPLYLVRDARLAGGGLLMVEFKKNPKKLIF